MSRRAQAVLAGGVLAFSTSVPAAAFAHEPDRRGEGVQVPEDPGVGELHDPGFDPGGDTALPFETAPVSPTPPAAGDEDEAAGEPLEVEPPDDPDARLVPPIEADPPTIDEPTAPEETSVPPAELVPPDGTPAPPQPELEAVVPNPQTEQPSSDYPPRPAPERPDVTPRSRAPEPVVVKQPVQAPHEPPAPVQAPLAVAEPEPVVLAQAGVPESDRPEAPVGGARTYVVAPGDSLWSIAKRLLGRDATPAKIAREVTRLWSLNAQRIGTGDPDLLMVGTHLSLR